MNNDEICKKILYKNEIKKNKIDYDKKFKNKIGKQRRNAFWC